MQRGTSSLTEAFHKSAHVAAHAIFGASLSCHLVHFDMQRGFHSLTQRRIQLLMVSYIYSAEEETFVPIPDMPSDLPLQISAAIQHLHQMSSGARHATSCFWTAAVAVSASLNMLSEHCNALCMQDPAFIQFH